MKVIEITAIALCITNALAGNQYNYEEGDYLIDGPDAHIVEEYFHFEKITEYTKLEITEFW